MFPTLKELTSVKKFTLNNKNFRLVSDKLGWILYIDAVDYTLAKFYSVRDCVWLDILEDIVRASKN